MLWFIAAVILFTAAMSYLQWRTRAAAANVQRIEQELSRKTQLETEQRQREAVQREAIKQALIEQKDAQRLAVIAEKQRADEAAQRAVIDEADRKAKAWTKFYRKPAACNDATTLECANAYIRAQRTFELKYSKGEL
jgi:parvulin-like peptidyl-prolyl isomerase